MYKAILFDLDGTVLDTISGIATALNASLKSCGYAFSFSDEQTKKLIGMGATNIIHRALKNHPHSKEEFACLLNVFKVNYQKFQGLQTKPYVGIIPLLEQLHSQGVKLFIASNKPHHLAKEIVGKLFPAHLFTEVRGHEEGTPEKPNPYLVGTILATHGLKETDCLFVGDSEVDVDTGLNSKLPVCLVTYGYGDYSSQLLYKATFVAATIEDLKRIVFA